MMRPNELLIDDSNFHKYVQDTTVDGIVMGRGHVARDYATDGYCSKPFMSPLSFAPIPQSEWSTRIKQKVEDKTQLSDIILRHKLPPKNQQQTNYCWINAPTMCLEIVRCLNGLPYVELSPASAGGPITGFRNVGGYGVEGLQWLVEHGCNPVATWPANAIDRKYYTEESKKEALNYRVTEWFDLRVRSFEELATCLLNNVPVAIGLNWWSHEVTALDLVEISAGVFGIRIYNSWGPTWEQGGMAVLSRSKGTPDDAVAPRVAILTA